MKPIVRYALLASAVVIAGGGGVWAMMDRPQSSPATSAAVVADRDPGQTYSRNGRGSGGKFFAQYDTDKDGRITREEFSKALADAFAQSTGGADAMTQAQYIAYRLKDLRTRTDQMFRRDDWNGDNKLTADEYAAPERARFESADRDGSGVIRCTSRGAQVDDVSFDGVSQQRGFGGRSGGSRAAICKYDDTNHDGTVTRAEFDATVAQEFASAAKGGALTADQFYAIVASHVHDSAVRTFTRLDTNGDGKLQRDEFAASELRYFAKLDRNNDGVVTRDETSARRYGANDNSKPGRT